MALPPDTPLFDGVCPHCQRPWEQPPSRAVVVAADKFRIGQRVWVRSDRGGGRRDCTVAGFGKHKPMLVLLVSVGKKSAQPYHMDLVTPV